MRGMIAILAGLVAAFLIGPTLGMTGSIYGQGVDEAQQNAMISGEPLSSPEPARGVSDSRQTCPGGSLFGQEPYPPSSDWAFYTSDVEPSGGPYVVYDNFTNVDGVSLVRFWGIQAHNPGTGWEACTRDPVPFEIVFYDDNAGEPGTAIATYNLSLTGTATGIFYNTVYELMEWEAVLTSSPPVGTSPGWVSIQASGDPACWFLWANSPDGDQSAFQWDGSTLNQLDDDLAFCMLRPVSVDFVARPRYIAVFDTVTFTDLTYSLDPVTEWRWDFGDNSFSSEENPVHEYQMAGSFDVKLYAANEAGSDSLVKEAYVNVADSSDWLTFGFSHAEIPGVWDMRAADLDHDNSIDLVFSHWLSNWGIEVAYGRGNGTFDPLCSYLSGGFQAFDFAFIDADSLIDFVVADGEAFHVMLNQDNREFSVVTHPFAGEMTPAIATGFFNNDAYVDLALTPNAIFLGDGQGGFSYYGSTPRSFRSVDVSEFNGDGFDDLIVATDSMIVMLNDGNGNFTRSWAMPTGYTSWSVTTAQALADFNRDGKRDFAALIPPIPPLSGSTLLVGLGDGTGGMQEVISIEVDGIAYKVTAADLNRDRCLDLAVADGGDGEAEIFFGDGSGEFSPPLVIDLSATYIVWNIASADFDRDGNPDLALGSQYLDEGELIIATNLLPDAPVLSDEMVISGYGIVSIEVSNPASFAISRNFITVAGADYWRYNLDDDAVHDESTVDYNMQYGEYAIQVIPRPGYEPGASFSVGIGINGSQQLVVFHDYFLPEVKDDGRSDGYLFYYTVEEASSVQPPNGKAHFSNPPTCDWSALLSSGTFDFQLDRYFDFRSPIYDVTGLSQPSYDLPDPLGVDSVFYWHFREVGESDWSRTFALYMAGDYFHGDADGNGLINISDAVYLISYIFGGGPAPDPLESGDADCNGLVNISDAVYLINYIFGGGPEPCAGY